MVIRSARDPRLNDVAANASMEDLLRASEQQYRTLKHGDVIEGSVMKLGRDEILVDIGAKTEGIIPNHELQSLSESEREALQVGDGLLVSVLQPENNEGHAVLSLDRARQEKSWRDLQKTFEAGEVIQAKVTGHNKGGLLVNLEGVRGFVPSSQVSSMPAGEANKQAEMARLQNQTLPLKIIEINRNRNRLILSERQAVQEQRETMRTRLLKELEPGQVRPGTVTSICDFGAFVDIGGADGLIHLSELSWKRVNHPSEVLKVGDRVNVHVLSVDPTERKIALSLKRTEPEPWSTITENYQLGQNVRGTITQLTSFGAFARLEDGIEGLIHVSELAEGRVAHPRNVVHEGEVLDLKVIRIDPARRRIGLSLKRMQEEVEGGAAEGPSGEGPDNQYGVTPGEPVQNQPLSQADQTEESPSALSQIPVALSAEREDEPTYDDEPMGALAQAFATRGISFANARSAAENEAEAAPSESLAPQAEIEETSVGEVYGTDLLPIATTDLSSELVATYEAEAAPTAAETHETTEANAPGANAGETSAPDANASPEAPVEQGVATATESAGASTDDTQEPATMMPAAADVEVTPQDTTASAAPSSEATDVQPASGESLSDVADMPDISPEQGSGEDGLGAPSGSEGAPSVADSGNSPEAGAEDTEGAGSTNNEG
ncbi:MAG: 30S ribosomal protein S1 [Chloroflexi bacterium]|nr:30S ribosomal protein S1 [Chloroflexota bacterium]